MDAWVTLDLAQLHMARTVAMSADHRRVDTVQCGCSYKSALGRWRLQVYHAPKDLSKVLQTQFRTPSVVKQSFV